MQARDNVGRRAGRREQAEDDLRLLITRPRFRQSRNLGQGRRTLRAGDGERAHRALLDVGDRGRNRGIENRRVSADGRGDGRPAAVEGNGDDVEPKRLLEHFAGKVAGRAQPGMGIAVFARARLDPGDELRERGCRNGWIDEQHLRRHSDQGNRRKIGEGIEAELGEQAGIDDQRAADDQDGVAVGRRLGDQGGADVAAAAGVILHVELLAKALRQLGCEHAGNHVDRPARRERRDQANGTIGIRRAWVLRERGAGDDERDCAAQQSVRCAQAAGFPSQPKSGFIRLRPVKIAELG